VTLFHFFIPCIVKKDHCRIIHLMTGYEFPWDVIRSLEMALMKPFLARKFPPYCTAQGVQKVGTEAI